MEQAQAQYPILKGLGLGYKYNPGGGQGYLEYWPGNETGTPQSPRPSEFPMGKAGIEVYNPSTRPIDIMGDVASHHMTQTDPTIKGYYQQFQESLTDEQKRRLHDQYLHAVQHEGETRPYQHWHESSGVPGYFRGYAFQQWDNPEELYTPEQMKMFDEMMKYLKKSP